MTYRSCRPSRMGNQEETLAFPADFEELWIADFREECSDPQVAVDDWRFCNAGGPGFLGSLAASGIPVGDAWTWVRAVSNGTGPHGATESQRVLQRIANWRAQGFSSKEALEFSSAGISLREATVMAKRGEDGQLDPGLLEQVRLLAALRA